MSTLPHLDQSWMFDLVSDDPRARGAALARHELASADYHEKRSAWYDLDRTRRRLARGGRPIPAALTARGDQALQALTEARDGTLVGLVDRYADPRTGVDGGRLAPYAALFLTLDNRYPETFETELAAKPPWHLKRAVLRRLLSDGVPDGCREMLGEAVVDSAYRLHRPEDEAYPRLARLLDGPGLRRELREAVRDEDVVVAARAGYLLWAAAEPTAPVTRASWRDWLVASLRD